MHPIGASRRKDTKRDNRGRVCSSMTTTKPRVASFRRASSRSKPEPALNDARYWSSQMLTVARSGDREGFLRIYDHFAPRVRMYLIGLGASDAVADELTQDAFLRVWQHAGWFDAKRGSVSTWLFRIARNLHIDRVRREPQWYVMPEDQAEERDGYATSAESHADCVDLGTNIDGLPAVQARIVRMSYFEAKSHHEIADELGMPLGTVKSHLRRAFLKLQSRMQDSI